ncbi:MAG: hypothetical protein GC162_06420 [Planctomycetes bacterium]|nr:hypothetical protein [Planctomycetota bacterium]
MGAWGFEAAHVYGSGLSDEQKKDAAIQLRRVARGYAEGKISKSDLDPHWQKISIPDPDKPGERKMKEHLTDSEILAFIEDMRTEADKAGVPNELYKIDFATEMKKAVDEVIGE